MKKRKMENIQQTIHTLMLSNKLNKAIANTYSAQLDHAREQEKFFIYCEVVNTKPLLSWVFNADGMITLGRQIENNQICIQDETVSRRQCCFFLWENELYVKNQSEHVPIYLKRKRVTYELRYQDMMCIFQKDRIKIGQAELQLLLLQGADRIVN